MSSSLVQTAEPASERVEMESEVQPLIESYLAAFKALNPRLDPPVIEEQGALLQISRAGYGDHSQAVRPTELAEMRDRLIASREKVLRMPARQPTCIPRMVRRTAAG